ncbi:hypothetical protein F0L68_29165 [Solihabitans fulvus]|uniref:Catalytic LigB subunit of aromatic ring-opening dioxygenase n=1 Tax=Solihabitans fulvus TaxID=1892852 RepID=A0A5B2WWM5_9PSEU|nr:class III extradiol dioxygenase subunit B-like domain-containing protein [Solihabitans fulvus]KAA2254856.1 hypothetical protein F0L68_29165 [Solihabitans fulvus]
MITRAVVVPNPPLLVPELVVGAAAETEPIRAACLVAAGALAGAATEWIAIGADPAGPVRLGPAARGTFLGYGVDVPVSLSADQSDGEADSTMPLPALVAGWLRGRVGANRVTVELVAPSLSVADCVAVGERIAAEAAGDRPVGLLVLGDGSNRHTERAPRRPDDRAEAFDGTVAEALAAADPKALLTLDGDLAAELGAVGRAAWQVFAGAALSTGDWHATRAEFLAPFGVGYHVAVWEPA